MQAKALLALALGGLAAADLVPRQTEAPTATQDAPEVTAITGCHLHGSDL